MVRSARFVGDSGYFPQDGWFDNGNRRKEDKQLETALEVVNKKKKAAAKAQKPKVVGEAPPPAFKMDDLGDPA